MPLVKYLTMTFSVTSPVDIEYPVAINQAWFPQFRVSGRFCVKGSNKRSDRRAL